MKVLGKVSGKLFGRSDPETYRFVVAEDHDLIAVENRMVAAAADFAFEGFAADDHLEIPNGTSHHLAFAGGFCIENSLHPEIGRKKMWHLVHGARVTSPG